MTNPKLTKEQKQTELIKYRKLVLATLDYNLDLKDLYPNNTDFDFVAHFEGLKAKTEEQFTKGRLTRLKQWFRDLTEMCIEGWDLKFNTYLHEKTGYDIDIFAAYHQRVEKIIAKGKITSDNQFYDISMIVDNLCQTEPVDKEKIERLNKLLLQYEQRKS
ncbi:MAG TPA: hypothetical protein VMR70_07160 [Flavisolibacter sp.]|nr:hypothetical protein [Flavisolibacter sp.]